MKLDDSIPCKRVFGHDKAKLQFISSIDNNTLHHAWLISGDKGIGKKNLVYDFIRALLRTGRTVCDAKRSDALHAIKQLEKAQHPDIMLITSEHTDIGDMKNHRIILIDEIRKMQAFLQLTPAQGGFRIAIIDDAECMNYQASNALLKILEEPPAHTIIFLICHSIGRLLPTIRSRCRILKCHPLSLENFTLVFQDLGYELSDEELKALYDASNGNITLGLKIHLSDASEIIFSIKSLLERGNKDNIKAIAKFAADEKSNWEIVTTIIQNLLCNQIKFMAQENKKSLSHLKMIEEVSNMLYDCQLYHLDKHNVIFSILNSIYAHSKSQ